MVVQKPAGRSHRVGEATPGVVALLLSLLMGPAPALAYQDDVPVPVSTPDALFGEADGWLTASRGQAGIAAYPLRGDGYHRWHGRVGGHMAIAQLNRDSLVRLGLDIQTVADDRNEIAFRLVRLYYDAFTGYEHRLGPGVVYGGYRHRCSHGADTAVDGRVLIRSGPELGYRLEHARGDWLLRAHAFGHASLIAQNDDLLSLPRALLATSGELRLRTAWVSWLLTGGFGAALLSSWQDWTVTIANPWRDLRLEPLGAAGLGAVLHGERADLRVLVHYQRILDTGVGQRADPSSLLSLQLSFIY